MAGVTAAVESAELGREVVLVERSVSLGGRVSRMKQYFPKLCPPYCGLEINYRRIKENPGITVLTSAEVTKIEPPGGDPFRDQLGYHAWNRGKRSAVLDLKNADDLEAFRKLAAQADVLVESFRPGVMERLARWRS